MKPVQVTHLPPSRPGQFMIEERKPGQPTLREIWEDCQAPKSLANAYRSVWAGRHGGWVRIA